MKLPALPTLKPRERLLAAGGGLAILILLLDALVLKPWLRHVQLVRREIDRMEQAIQHNNRLLARREQVEAQLARYARYVRPPLADELRMAMLLKEIEGLAEESGVLLGEIKPLGIESGGERAQHALDVQFECTLEEWVDLLIKLETSPSLFEVMRAALSVQEEAPDRLKGSLRVASSSLRAQGGSRPASGDGDARTATP